VELIAADFGVYQMALSKWLRQDRLNRLTLIEFETKMTAA
jgi:transposase-like protein